MGKSPISMAIVSSYVKLPEGMSKGSFIGEHCYVKLLEGISKGSFIGKHSLLARNIQWISVDCTIPMVCQN